MKKIQNQIDGIQEKFKSIFRGSVISTTTTKLMSFIQIADARARIIIIINSIIIPFSLSKISDPAFMPSVILALITAALSVYAAIMSLYPKQRRKKSLDLLHFSDIAKLTESRYRERLKEIFNDYDKLSEAAVKDIYHLSKYILQPKFVWIKASYLIFIVGYIITLAVVVYTKLHL